MNHYVPEQGRSRLIEEDELLELVWQNGPVVIQRQKSPKKLSQSDAVLDVRSSAVEDASPHPFMQEGEKVSHRDTVLDVRPCAATAAVEGALRHLLMQEDDKVSWINFPYPLDDSFDRDFSADLPHTSPISNSSHSSRVTQIQEENRIPAVDQLSRIESRPPILHMVARESTVMDSNETPAVGPKSRASQGARSLVPFYGCGSMTGDTMNTDSVVGEEVKCEPTVTSSSGGSGGSADNLVRPTTADRKRKAIEADDNTECYSEDVESMDMRKQARGSTSARRARAAEIHNLSERKRRDRINDKMKALQELIPRCNKSDKASMLDEAIEYLKSLQLQVQIMSMGCSMFPMMFPSVQQYMPPVGMGMGMGMRMGMGMGMGMNRSMVPFPSILAGSAMPNLAAAAHLSQSLPSPPFHLHAVSLPDLSRMQAQNQLDPSTNSMGVQSLNQHEVLSPASISSVPWPLQDADSSLGLAKHLEGS